MEKQISTIVVFLVLCLLGQIKAIYSQTLVDLGSLKGMAKMLAKPAYPETVEKYAVGGSVKINVTVNGKGNVTKAVSTPDNTQICQSLLPMNASFQALKNSFVPIVEMKNQGELSGVDLKNQIEAREAQQVKIQEQINAAAAKYGCQLK